MLMAKRWARAQDINDASKCTISSFSLGLMVIHYLQGNWDVKSKDNLVASDLVMLMSVIMMLV